MFTIYFCIKVNAVECLKNCSRLLTFGNYLPFPLSLTPKESCEYHTHRHLTSKVTQLGQGKGGLLDSSQSQFFFLAQNISAADKNYFVAHLSNSLQLTKGFQICYHDHPQRGRQPYCHLCPLYG